MANEVVGIDIVARLDGFRAELAKIPDIGGKEAKALVGQLSREIKAAEKASRAAAGAARAHKVEVQGLAGAIAKAQISTELLKKGFTVATQAVSALIERAEVLAETTGGDISPAMDELRGNVDAVVTSLATGLGPELLATVQMMGDLVGAANLAARALTGVEDAFARQKSAADAANAALDRQSARVEALKAELATAKELADANGWSAQSYATLTAEVERQIDVLRRLRAETAADRSVSTEGFSIARAGRKAAPTKAASATKGAEPKIVTEDIAGAIGELRSLTDAVAEASESATQRVINDAARQVEAISVALSRIEGLTTASASTKQAAQEAAAEAEIAIIQARDEQLLAMEAEQRAAMQALDDEATQRAIDNARMVAEERAKAQEMYLGIVGATFGAIGSVIEAATETAIASTAEESRARKEAMQDAWAASAALAIAQAAVNVPLSVSNAVGNAPNPIVGAVMGIAAGIASGAALAAVIAKAAAGPQFHAGGMVTRTADEVPATLLSGESVLNRDATRRLGEGGVRGLNRGESGGGPLVVVQQFRHRVLDAAISDSLSRRRGPLYDAVAASRPKAGMHSPWI